MVVCDSLVVHLKEKRKKTEHLKQKTFSLRNFVVYRKVSLEAVSENAQKLNVVHLQLV